MDPTYLMLIFGGLAVAGLITIFSGGDDDDDTPAAEPPAEEPPVEEPPVVETPDPPVDETPDPSDPSDGETPDPTPTAPYTFARPNPDLSKYDGLPVFEPGTEFGDIFGTPDAERIDDTTMGGRVNGLGGDDALFGDGDSFLMGGEGDDLIVIGDDAGEFGFSEGRGGDGADIILGGTGNDYLIAGGPNDSDTFFATLPDGPLDFDTPDTTPGDLLVGGAGSDVLAFGAGDYAEGGDDADAFVLLETELVAAADNPAFIIDYVPGESIELMDAGDAEVTFGTEGDDAVILVDGTITVVLRGAAETFDPDDVTVIAGRLAWGGEGFGGGEGPVLL